MDQKEAQPPPEKKHKFTPGFKPTDMCVIHEDGSFAVTREEIMQASPVWHAELASKPECKELAVGQGIKHSVLKMVLLAVHHDSNIERPRDVSLEDLLEAYVLANKLKMSANVTSSLDYMIYKDILRQGKPVPLVFQACQLAAQWRSLRLEAHAINCLVDHADTLLCFSRLEDLEKLSGRFHARLVMRLAHRCDKEDHEECTSDDHCGCEVCDACDSA